MKNVSALFERFSACLYSHATYTALKNILGKNRLPHLRSLSLTVDVEGHSKTMPRLIRNMASRARNLQSIAIHAIWFVNSKSDLSGPSLFIPPRCGWEEADEKLSLLASLQKLRVGVTPHATCTPGALGRGHSLCRPTLSKGVLDRANWELFFVFRRTRKTAHVEVLA